MRQGSALLSALFVMTLVAIAATAMSMRLQLDIYRTQMAIESDKLYLASQAVAFWTMEQVTSKKILPTSIDNEGKLMTYPKRYDDLYPGVIIQGNLYDLQARFNLNNLEEKNARQTFSNLLKNTLTNTNNQKRAYIVQAASHWISPYRIEHGQDDLTTHYLEQKPPYQPSHQPMQSVSEFRLIAGVEPKVYDAVSPYLTALPRDTKINLNTAPRQVLQALGEGLNDAEVEEIIQTRGNNPILELKDVKTLLEKLHIPLAEVTVESEYFLSVAHVKAAEMDLTNYTVIQRTKNKEEKFTARILTETLNTL